MNFRPLEFWTIAILVALGQVCGRLPGRCWLEAAPSERMATAFLWQLA